MDIGRYKNIPYETRDSCMVCGKKLDDSLIDMPNFPLSEIYVDRKISEKLARVDQGFCFCTYCGHAQLKNVIDVKLQYTNDSAYFFRTSASISGRETTNFFINFFKKIVKDKKFKTIVEIGCNDLYLLKSLKLSADKLIGIDPILKGKEKYATEDNIVAIGDFFENVTLDTDVDLVICKDTLEHVSYPKEFLKKIIDKASNDALFFFQFPILDTILEECRFDQVFHQHLNYFSLHSILYLLDELECRLLSHTIDYSHWGTILIAFQKATNRAPHMSDTTQKITPNNILERYKSFKIDMMETSKRLQYFQNEIVYGYGAALMLPVLSWYLENDLSSLECIIDDDINKDNLFYINLPVPIRHRSKVPPIENSVIFLTAIFSKINTRRILENLLKMNTKHIIYPLKTI